jgi:hypothetical protein
MGLRPGISRFHLEPPLGANEEPACSAKPGWAPTNLSLVQEACRWALWSLVSDLALSWVGFLRFVGPLIRVSLNGAF